MKKKIDVTKFEILVESGEVLKGGFSTAYSGANSGIWDKLMDIGDIELNSRCGTTNNNCGSANCVAGCGAK